MSSSHPAPEHRASTNPDEPRSKRPLGGKLAIVTGASRGIGTAIATNLASKGCKLVLNHTSNSSASSCHSLAASLTSFHGALTLVVQADMGTPDGPAHLITQAKSHFTDAESGSFQIDIIINNAGVSNNLRVEDITIADFEWQYRVNVLGPLLLIQAAAPYLPHDRSGRIVNVSSVSSSEGFIGQSVYGGTKAALEAMTRTWARELAERATVNAINPGPVNTDMWKGTTAQFKRDLRPWIQKTPLSAVREGVDDEDLVKGAGDAGGRPAYTEEVAGVVGMLCGEDSVWVTGQVVCANGGMRMAI